MVLPYLFWWQPRLAPLLTPSRIDLYCEGSLWTSQAWYCRWDLGRTYEVLPLDQQKSSFYPYLTCRAKVSKDRRAQSLVESKDQFRRAKLPMNCSLYAARSGRILTWVDWVSVKCEATPGSPSKNQLG